MRIGHPVMCGCVVFSLVCGALTPFAVGQNVAAPGAEVLVEVTRGNLVESRHYGRLVAVDKNGKTLLAIGDPDELIFPRSALKPIQALATVYLAQEHGVALETREIAMMCASHEGHDYHVEAVSLLLKRAGATEEDLYCGAVNGTRLCHNCSGKHGGMLVHAKIAGEPLLGYWQLDHAVQRRIQQVIQEFTDYDRPLQWGIDGCGVPNYALPLNRLALAYARFANPDLAPEKYRASARAIRDAMQAHPELISSRGSFDARLVESAEGRLIGKTGAEACYAIGMTEPSIGIAVKIEDGNPRGMPCVLLFALEKLGGLSDAMRREVGNEQTIDLTNSVGDVIGQIRSRR